MFQAFRGALFAELLVPDKAGGIDSTSVGQLPERSFDDRSLCRDLPCKPLPRTLRRSGYSHCAHTARRAFEGVRRIRPRLGVLTHPSRLLQIDFRTGSRNNAEHFLLKRPVSERIALQDDSRSIATLPALDVRAIRLGQVLTPAASSDVMTSEFPFSQDICALCDPLGERRQRQFVHLVLPFSAAPGTKTLAQGS